MNQLCEVKSCNIQRVSNYKWSEAIANYRFLSNPRVTEHELIKKIQSTTKKLVTGRRILAIHDTSEINIINHLNRIDDFEGIGSGTNDKCLGFFVHPILLYDIDTQAPIGLGNIHLFNRQLVYEKKMRPNYVDPIEDKESDKWYTPNLQARDEVLNESKQIVYVSDRESDIYEVLATLPNDKTDIIVRSKSNRKIGDNQYSATKIEDYLNKTKSQHKIEFYHDFKVNGIHKRKLIKASIKFGEVKIKRPDKSVHLKNYEDDIRYNLVEVKELGSWNENKRQRINWILLTTLNVKSIEEALEVVGFYKKRWNIEEFFRLMKSEGFNIEQTELEKGSSIRKLTIMIMEASMLILKLKSGRSVESTIRLIECFDENQIKCLEGLNRKLEGNTDKQKNPYSIESLSYASWIIARLGGWMGYQSQRPPGTITFKKGLESFCAIYIGYSIANVKHDVYKR